MSLRVRLVLAFVGLAVLPLLGVTLYSYFSSARALRQAARAEVQAMTEDLGRRMDEVAAELSDRLERMRRRQYPATTSRPLPRPDATPWPLPSGPRSCPVLGTVLALTERRQDEVPFAIDDQGQIYAADGGRARPGGDDGSPRSPTRQGRSTCATTGSW